MKTRILFVIIIFFCLPHLNAQIKQGTKTIGLQGNLSSSKYASSFTFAPSMGVFAKNNWLIGVEHQVHGHHYKRIVNGDVSTQHKAASMFISPYSRYYFNLSEKSSIFLHAEAGFGTMFTQDQNNNGEISISTNAGAGVGYSYFITKNIALEGNALIKNYGAGVYPLEFKIGTKIFLGR